jgi:hypothetical protein
MVECFHAAHNEQGELADDVPNVLVCLAKQWSEGLAIVGASNSLREDPRRDGSSLIQSLSRIGVNWRSKLPPARRPILAPLSDGF